MTEAVKIRGLTKNYNGLLAVDNLDLTVPVGSIYGFLGPNGAGKTTTLKMIAGMTEPSDGEIEIMGKTVKFGSNQNREMIGYLPDVPGFYDWMNPTEFLKFCGDLYNIDKSILDKRIIELLQLVNLYKQKKKKIGTFSRGMKQRLGIAQALIHEPKVVLLDEPVSALDPIGRKEVMDIILSLANKVTVFFSSHILADVERICDRIVIINEGKKLLEDSIENIKQVPDIREIEIEFEDKEDLQKIEEIKDENIVEEISVDNLKVLIKAFDIDKLRAKLNQIFFENNIFVKKMIVKEVSLEDIFIKVVNHHD